MERSTTSGNTGKSRGRVVIRVAPETETWYRNIRALPAGHYVWIDAGRVAQPRQWWDIAAAWREAPLSTRSPEEVRERVHAALRKSVNAHLVSDVPIGVFL